MTEYRALIGQGIYVLHHLLRFVLNAVASLSNIILFPGFRLMTLGATWGYSVQFFFLCSSSNIVPSFLNFIWCSFCFPTLTLSQIVSRVALLLVTVILLQ